MSVSRSKLMIRVLSRYKSESMKVVAMSKTWLLKKVLSMPEFLLMRKVA